MADRDVKVTLNLTAGDQSASKALKAAADEAERAAALLGKAGQSMKSLDGSQAAQSATQLKAVSDAAARAEQATKALGQAQSQLKAPGPSVGSFSASQPSAAYSPPSQPSQPSSSVNLGQAFANAAVSNAFRPSQQTAISQPKADPSTGSVDKLNRSLSTLAAAADKAAVSTARAAEAQARAGSGGTGFAAPVNGRPATFPVNGQQVNPQALLSGTPQTLGNQGRPPVQTQATLQPQGAVGQVGQPKALAGVDAASTGLASVSSAAGPLAISLGVLAASTKLAEKALTMAAAAADANRDATLSQEKAQRRIIEALDPTGIAKALGGLTDVLTGKTEAIRRQQRSSQLDSARSAAEISSFQQSLPLINQIKQNDLRATADASTPFVQFNPPPRTGGNYDDLNYAQAERRSQLELQRRRAEIEVKASQGMAGNLGADRSDLQNQYEQQQRQTERLRAEARAAANTRPPEQQPTRRPQDQTDRQLDAIRKKLLGVTGIDVNDSLSTISFGTVTDIKKLRLGANTIGGDGRLNLPGSSIQESSQQDKRGLEAQEKIAESLRKEEELRQKLIATGQAQSQAAQQSAQAESNLRKSLIALQQDELNSLKEKEALIKGQAQAFGNLNALERQAASEAAARAKQVGFENLTPEEKAAITAGGGGQYLQTQAEKSALNDPLRQKFAQDLGLEYDLKANQKKQLELQAEIVTNIQVDEQKLATQMKDTMEPILLKLVELLKGAVKASTDKVTVEQKIGQTSS